MTATLTAAPNPIAPGGNVRIDGAGFDPSKKVQLTLDGAGASTNYFRPAKDGSFHVGMIVSSVPATQTVAARYAGSSTIVAQTSLVVANPAPQPPMLKSVTVASVASLLSTLTDNTVDEIVVANGTYHVSSASNQASDSLWIGSKTAPRTRPISVRAQTAGQVLFDAGGATYFGGITFVDGAHDQTWDGFTFQNGTPTQTGVVMYGGYAGSAAPHHITLRNTTIRNIVGSSQNNDHAVYFSYAVGGPHDIVIDGMTVTSTGASAPPVLSSAIHVFHSDASNVNAWNVTINNLNVTGTFQGIILWDTTIHDWTIKNTTITGPLSIGVRYEGPAQRILLDGVVTKSSPNGGFYSTLGANPPGIAFNNCVFN